MTNRYTADGRRRSSMAHASHPHLFSCGKVTYGNGATMHRRAHGCRELTVTQWVAAGGTYGALGIGAPPASLSAGGATKPQEPCAKCGHKFSSHEARGCLSCRCRRFASAGGATKP